MDKVEIQRVHVRDGIASKAQKSTVLVSFSLKAAMADAIKRTVHRYSNDDRSYKQLIDKLIGKTSCLTTIIYRDTQYDHVEEHLEKRLSRAELASEIEELIEYYKYYKDCPIVSDRINFQLMLDYWEKIKTVYYRRVQAMLNLPIDEETVHTNLEKNASDLEDQKETKNASTFYIMKYLLGDKQPAKQVPKGDETVEHLLKNLKSKQLLLHYRHSSLEQIDRAYKFVKTTEQDRKPVPFTYLTQGGKTISKEPSSKKWKTVRTNNSSCKSLLNDQKNVLESKEYRQKQSQKRNSLKRRKHQSCQSMQDSHIKSQLKVIWDARPQSKCKDIKSKMQNQQSETTKLFTYSKQKRKPIENTCLQKKEKQKALDCRSQEIRSIIMTVKHRMKEEKSLMLRKLMDTKPYVFKPTQSVSDKLQRFRK